jgi:hypothetical protein
MITTPMRRVVADPAPPPVVVVALHCVLSRVFVSVFAIVRQWCAAYVLRTRSAEGPVSKLPQLNRRISPAVALTAKRNQVIQVIGAIKPTRDFMVNVQQLSAPLELKSAILTFIPVTQSCSIRLSFPVRTTVFRRAIRMQSYSDGLPHVKPISLTRIGAKLSGNRLALPSLKLPSAVEASEGHARHDLPLSLTFFRAIARGAISVVGVIRNTAIATIQPLIFTFWSGSHRGPFYPIYREACR